MVAAGVTAYEAGTLTGPCQAHVLPAIHPTTSAPTQLPQSLHHSYWKSVVLKSNRNHWSPTATGHPEDDPISLPNTFCYARRKEKKWLRINSQICAHACSLLFCPGVFETDFLRHWNWLPITESWSRFLIFLRRICLSLRTQSSDLWSPVNSGWRHFADPGISRQWSVHEPLPLWDSFVRWGPWKRAGWPACTGTAS